jgi:translation initiation factor 2B subunit (eIF-2B alpha/beta/delta family)
MSEKSQEPTLVSIGEDIQRVLAALGGVSDRLDSLEARVASVEEGQAKLIRTVERVDHKINAIARKLLSNAECEALNIRDARPRGGSPSALTGDPPL